MSHPSPESVRRSSRLLGTVVALALTGFALSACSGESDSPEPAPATSAPTASESQAPSLPKGVKPASIPTKVANDPDDRKNVVLTGCEATDDGWGASGTATNTTKSDVTYDVTVFFTTTSATTINSARTKVDVKAGETVKWDASAKFTHPSQMLCVLRGVAAV